MLSFVEPFTIPKDTAIVIINIRIHGVVMLEDSKNLFFIVLK
jgi:hypothetical protein